MASPSLFRGFSRFILSAAAAALFWANVVPAAPTCLNSTDGEPSFLGVPVDNAFTTAEIIDNRYIVVYNSTFADDVIDEHEAMVTSMVKKRNLGKRGLSGHLLSTDVRSMRVSLWRCMVLESDDA